MKCSDCVPLIARKLDGMLTAEEIKEVEAHLSHCGRCRAEMVLQRKVVEALKRGTPEGVSDDFTRRVAGRAAELAGGAVRRRFRLADLIPAVPALAACLLLVIFREDVGGLLGPAVEAFAARTGGPLAAFGNRVAEALAGLPAVPDGDLPGAGVLARIFANIYVGAAMACAAAVWAFSKAFEFVRG